MNKEQHNQEIIQTRVGGFGSSDAEMFLRIARRGNVNSLSRTDSIRIAVAMGLRPSVETPTTEAMERGHRFEDWFEEHSAPACADRERRIDADRWSEGLAFRLFAHADYYQRDTDTVYELKCSIADTDTVLSRYMAQLQWYYMLSPQVKNVVLVHCRPSEDGLEFLNPFVDEFQDKDVADVSVPRNEEVIELLLNGIQILDEAIKDDWEPRVDDSETFDELPSSLQAAFLSIRNLEERKKDIEEKISDCKSQLLDYMQRNGLAVIVRGDTVLSLTAETETRSFDSVKFFKAHPEMLSLRSEFEKVTKRKAFVSMRDGTKKKG